MTTVQVTPVVPAPAVPVGVGQQLVASPAGPSRHRFVIDLRHVTKTYALGDIRIEALRDVSLQVERGDYVAIMGASGSGKSTLMNVVGCLDLPTTGRYLLDGVDVRNMSEDDLSDIRNRKIGFVFQTFNLIARMEAILNVELPLVYAGLRRAERRRRAEHALALVGLSDRMHHMPSELSGGQQQRVAIARALVTNPALLLADEPTGNVDSTATHELMDIFDRLNGQGRTVVVITHEDEVASHAKRVIRLRDGQIIEDRREAPAAGPPPRLLHAPLATDWRAGSPATSVAVRA